MQRLPLTLEFLVGITSTPHAQPTGSEVAPGLQPVWLVLWLVPVAALLLFLAARITFTQIMRVFLQSGRWHRSGEAYPVLSYVAAAGGRELAVGEDPVRCRRPGMAETTPGRSSWCSSSWAFMAASAIRAVSRPMLAGTLGGLLATWVTFMPCFLFIFLGAPFIEVMRGNKALAGALSAITAAVVGVILNLAIWFAIHTVFREVRRVEGYGFNFEAPVLSSVDPWALVLSLAAIIAMFRFQVGMITTLAACSVAGMALYLMGAIS
jgi:chromate transporter